MKKHANGRVICIDTTHGTNGYDFTLISVLIVDEYGEGFSVAWVISNWEDQILLMNFFRALKRRIVVVSPAYIMSDLAEQFHTAWMAMFGNSPTKLVCVWHVDRAWRENIQHLSDHQLQVRVCHNLRLLLEGTDKQKFELLLKQTLEHLKSSNDTKPFAKYFEIHIKKTVGILLL